MRSSDGVRDEPYGSSSEYDAGADRKRMSETITIGIDLGGTKIEAAIVDSKGEKKRTLRQPTRVSQGPDAVVDQICQMIETLREQSPHGSPIGVGIGVAGQIDTDTGLVRGAPNLDWHDFPLGEKLQSQIPIPVTIDNDVRLATYGEWRHGAGLSIDNLICIFVGTGVGGGIVSDGRLLRGHHNTAGEIGHTVVQLNGIKCRCGNHGCLEAYAGGWAMAHRAREFIEENPEKGAAIIERADHDKSKITAQSVSEAARDGDELALQILDDAVDALAAGCVSLVNTLGPRRIILGGGVIEGHLDLIDRIASRVRKAALPAALVSFDIVRAALGPHAGVIGAASAARDIKTRKEYSQ